MTAGQAILLDLLVAILGLAGWLAAGVMAALGRLRLGLWLLAAAVIMTLARVVTVMILAGHGWWFVQEKVLLGLPLLGAAGLIAVVIAGRPLIKAWRSPEPAVSPGSVVALLTAGYAAVAGLVATFLIGYPLTWAAALIMIGGVGLAALLTARVVAPNAVAEPAERPAFSRRRLLTLAGGAVAVGATGAGTAWSFQPGESVSTGGGPASLAHQHRHGSVADLRGARRPAPGGVVRRHVLTARTATVRLPSGRTIEAWTYDARLPGPAITATQGDLIEVTLRNTDLEDGVTLHWHGYDVACGEDGAPGVTQQVVAPGGEFVYHFRADQVGTYWYHTHQASHLGVRKGLYGTLVVQPRDRPEGLDLVLPVHTFDGVTVLGDQEGRFEHQAAAGTPVRLRLINTDSDPHWFALAGTPFRVAAVDGRDLNRPGQVSRVGLRLPAGGRYDVIFDLPDTPVDLVLDHDRDGGLRLRPTGAVAAEPPVEDMAGWPELDLLHYGEPGPVPFDPGRPDRHFELVLDRGIALVDGQPAYAQTVNGRGHPSIPDQLVTEGELVAFTVANRSLETHPWHLHGHPVLILSRDGIAASGSPLWVDTFDVRPGEVWQVVFRATNPGIWMNHCHNLPHAEQGMMLKLTYDGVTTPFGGSHGSHGSHSG
jgi:FtsP/CotA-like multicopper oxidase with cupredoxin domain